MAWRTRVRLWPNGIQTGRRARIARRHQAFAPLPPGARPASVSPKTPSTDGQQDAPPPRDAARGGEVKNDGIFAGLNKRTGSGARVLVEMDTARRSTLSNPARVALPAGVSYPVWSAAVILPVLLCPSAPAQTEPSPAPPRLASATSTPCPLAGSDRFLLSPARGCQPTRQSRQPARGRRSTDAPRAGNIPRRGRRRRKPAGDFSALRARLARCGRIPLLLRKASRNWIPTDADAASVPSAPLTCELGRTRGTA